MSHVLKLLRLHNTNMAQQSSFVTCFLCWFVKFGWWFISHQNIPNCERVLCKTYDHCRQCRHQHHDPRWCAMTNLSDQRIIIQNYKYCMAKSHRGQSIRIYKEVLRVCLHMTWTWTLIEQDSLIEEWKKIEFLMKIWKPKETIGYIEPTSGKMTNCRWQKL